MFAEFSNEVFKKTKFEMPEFLGYDEKYWLGHFCCVVGNIKERTLINILPGRDIKVLDAYFESRADRHKVKVVCIDMRKEFRSIARKWFPDAAIVVDRFHVEGMAVAVVEIIRKQEAGSLDHGERVQLKRDAKLLLLRGGGDDEDSRARLSKWFERLPRLAAAYWTKERFANIYDTKCSSAEAELKYKAWKASIPKEVSFETSYRFFRSFYRWRREIFPYWNARFTTNYLEGFNRSIEALNRAGAGYSFDRMKAKIILSQSTHKLGKRRKFRRMDLSTGDLRPGFFNSLGGSGAGGDGGIPRDGQFRRIDR